MAKIVRLKVFICPGRVSRELHRLLQRTLTLTIEREGLQSVSTGFNLFQIGAEHRAGKRTWLSHVYTHLQKSYFLFSNVGESPVTDPDETVYLNQYYLGATTLLKPGLDIRFGFHYINLASV